MILYISYEYLPFKGGIASLVANLFNSSALAQARISLICPSYDRALDFRSLKVLRHHQFAVFHLVFISFLYLKRDYKIIHCFDIRSALIVAVLSFVFRYKTSFIVSFHGSEVNVRRKFLKRKIIEFIASRADTLIVNSGLTERILRENCNVSSKVNVFFPDVDRSWLPHSAAKHIQKTRVIFCSVGRVVERKGHRKIIKFLEKFQKVAGLPVEYIIVGVPENDIYERTIKELGSKSKVIVSLKQNLTIQEVQKIYSSSIAHILLPESGSNKIEGFGFVIFEAGLNRTISIINSNCGAAELITHLHDGFILSENNEHEIVNHLLRMLEKPSLRNAMEDRIMLTSKQLCVGNYAKRHQDLYNQFCE
jgi:phosphatidylinositol alpha-1,6-mannosyltransferase